MVSADRTPQNVWVIALDTSSVAPAEQRRGDYSKGAYGDGPHHRGVVIFVVLIPDCSVGSFDTIGDAREHSAHSRIVAYKIGTAP